MNRAEMINHLNTLDMLLANRCSKAEIAEDLVKLDLKLATDLCKEYGFMLVEKELMKLTKPSIEIKQ